MNTSPKPSEKDRLERALHAIRSLRSQLEEAERTRTEPIAIVGLGCRFPGGDGPGAFWELLKRGGDAVSEVAPGRWDLASCYDPDPDAPGKMYCRHGGFLGSIDGFDAGFFGVSPREAAAMDPQQRLFLEVAWEALEGAAIPPDRLMGTRSGVFVGIGASYYSQRNSDDSSLCAIDAHTLTGIAPNAAAGRLSYFLGVSGPTMAVDTACSSSLVAVHLACQSLRMGECQLALAGGVNLMLTEWGSIGLSRMRALAPDGRCKAFDAGADGFCRGEGCGAIVLKRLRDAQADGDRVLALIRGSAVNQDGRTSGFTVPNGLAQRALIREALARAALAPADVDFVEAHGTGTALGDPIELEALAEVLAGGRAGDQPLLVGSVKTNIGHLEAAAGVAGLIKAVLALVHELIPPQLHFRSLNPRVELRGAPVEVVTEPRRWARSERRRVAGVSSFGLSGTNAHVLVEEAPAAPVEEATLASADVLVLPLSARTPEALSELARRWAAYLESPGVDAAGACRTAAWGRTHFACRLGAVAATAEELAAELRRRADAVKASRAQVAMNPADVAARAYEAGSPVDWAKVVGPRRGGIVDCPTYPFQRNRYWLGPPKADGQRKAAILHGDGPASHPLLGRRLRAPLMDGFIFEAVFTPEFPSFLQDHRIYGTVVVPGSCFLVMALSAAEAVFGQAAWALDDIGFVQPLFLRDGERRTVQLVLKKSEGPAASFVIISFGPGEESLTSPWTTHATGNLRPAGSPSLDWPSDGFDLGALKSRCSETIPSPDVFYELARPEGLDLGPTFRCLGSIWRRAGEAIGQIRAPEDVNGAETNLLHPGVIDSCFQLMSAALPLDHREFQLYIPFAIDRFTIFGQISTPLWCQASLEPEQSAGPDLLKGDLCLFDETGRVVARMAGLRLRRATRESLLLAAQARSLEDWFFKVEWRPTPLAAVAGSNGPDRTGRWLILSDGEGIGASLAARFTSAGWDCVLVQAGASFQAEGPDRFRINPREPADFVRLLEKVARPGDAPLIGVIHFWGLDIPVGDDDISRQIEDPRCLGCATALHLVQALARLDQAESPRLFLVTRGANVVVPGESPALSQAGLAGLGRVIALEQPALRCLRIDLDPTRATNDLDVLENECRGDDREDQVAYRGGARFAARLVPDRSVGSAAGRAGREHPDRAVQLTTTARGVLENLVLRPVSRRRPGPGEVEIRVRATGLNFRDVLNVLGMLPANLSPPGLECAGRVVAVGGGVIEYRVDDEVMAIVPGCFSSHVTVSTDFVVRRPPGLNEVEAASIPIAFLTAHYALHNLAGMKAGDRVLIHAAAGGVGLAAVRLAMRAGAVVFATAGNPEKRQFLRDLGVPHVMDSRSLSFVEEVRAVAGERGLDIVLNSLNEQFIPASLALLSSGGRFLEIGKRGIWERDQVARARPDVAYSVLDIGELTGDDRTRFRALFRDLIAQFECGELRPLPTRVFPMAQAVEAFRYLSQAKQIGKVVITQDSSVATVRPDRPLIRSGATYLITGGLGGLGLTIAAYLVDRGASSLVLIGRRPPSEAATASIAVLRKAGAEVRSVQVDVASRGDLAAALGRIDRELPPLRGVVHCAGVLDDATLLELTVSRLRNVLEPKAKGAWNLHELTADSALDFLVLFSSTASVLGSAGQGNYAAANAFLDALGHRRRAEGLPGLSINWGPWAGVGMAAKMGDRERQRIAAHGIGMISPEQGVQAMEHLLSGDDAQAVVLPLRWDQFGHFDPEEIPPLMSELVQLARSSGDAEGAAVQRSRLARLVKEAPAGKMREVLIAELRAQVVRLLGFDSSRTIDPHQPLGELGLDSLLAVEMRNTLGTLLGRTLPVTLLFDYPTLDALAARIALDLRPEDQDESTAAKCPDGEAERSRLMAEIRDLSQADVLASLAQELSEIRRESTS